VNRHNRYDNTTRLQAMKQASREFKTTRSRERERCRCVLFLQCLPILKVGREAGNIADEIRLREHASQRVGLWVHQRNSMEVEENRDGILHRGVFRHRQEILSSTPLQNVTDCKRFHLLRAHILVALVGKERCNVQHGENTTVLSLFLIPTRKRVDVVVL